MTGDIIISQRANNYELNDIITFHNSFGDIITHRIVTVDQSAGDGFKYYTRTVVTSGDADFCNSLKVEVYDRKFYKKFSGRLVDLSFNSQLEKGEMKDFIFLVSFDDNRENLKNKLCGFAFDFKTYRDKPGETGGIFAQRTVENIIFSGSW